MTNYLFKTKFIIATLVLLVLNSLRADDLLSTKSSEQFEHKNATNTKTIIPKPVKPYENRRLDLKTIDPKLANRLRMYFEFRDECPFELNKTSVDPNNLAVKYCPSTADYLLCFPSTPPNKTISFKCPYRKDLDMRDDNNTVTRTCNTTGGWESSNYHVCINAVAAINTTMQHNSEQHIFKLLALFNFIGFCITVTFVSFAIFIFLSIRSLRCTRNMIHCNMLFTFFFKSTTHIGFYVFMATKKNMNYKISDLSCVLFNILLNYSLMCSFFWMMIEAVYLITVIVAAYSSNKIKLWWYLIIGWILPMVPIVPYTIMTLRETSTCSWIQSTYNPPYEIMIDIPIYILLVINCILLILILYVIISKLRTHNDAVKTKYIQYKKLTRATLVLFPLFGLTFAVCFYLPTDPTTLFAKIYYFVNVFLQTTQGVWVAFVYCFLNDEVKNAIKTKLRSWKISRLKISRLISLTNTATRNHSFPTIYSTQITSNHSSITRNRQDTTINPNDPSRLPILQEDKV